MNSCLISSSMILIPRFGGSLDRVSQSTSTRYHYVLETKDPGRLMRKPFTFQLSLQSMHSAILAVVFTITILHGSRMKFYALDIEIVPVLPKCNLHGDVFWRYVVLLTPRTLNLKMSKSAEVKAILIEILSARRR
jgi:hypothetical protein